MTINIDSKKEAILKKIFGVDDLTPIINKVLEDWGNGQINLKAGNLTIDEKIAVLEAKEKPIKIGGIKTKK